jgi:predicted Zn-dependent protease
MFGRTTRIFLWLGLSLLVVSEPLGLALASSAQSGSHWARKQTPFTLEVGDNVDGVWDSLLPQAIAQWNQSGTVNLSEINGSTDPQSCTPRRGVVEVCSGQYGTQDGWLGLTRVFMNAAGNHIDAVTVQFNDSFFDQSGGQYNNSGARQHTACHEMGHSLGLDHVNTDSCMNNSQSAIFKNVTPVSSDFQTLAQTYSHRDSSVTVGGEGKKPKHKGGNKKNHHKRKGHHKQPISGQSANDDFFAPTSLPAVPGGLSGSDTQIVQTLENGRKVVTFVSWADK